MTAILNTLILYDVSPENKRKIQDAVVEALAIGRGEGRVEGRVEGRAEGFAEGFAEGRAATAAAVELNQELESLEYSDVTEDSTKKSGASESDSLSTLAGEVISADGEPKEECRPSSSDHD